MRSIEAGGAVLQFFLVGGKPGDPRARDGDIIGQDGREVFAHDRQRHITRDDLRRRDDALLARRDTFVIDAQKVHALNLRPAAAEINAVAVYIMKSAVLERTVYEVAVESIRRGIPKLRLHKAEAGSHDVESVLGCGIEQAATIEHDGTLVECHAARGHPALTLNAARAANFHVPQNGDGLRPGLQHHQARPMLSSGAEIDIALLGGRE